MSSPGVWKALDDEYLAKSALGHQSAEDIARSLKGRFRAWAERDEPLCPKPTQHRVKVFASTEGSTREAPRSTIALTEWDTRTTRHPSIALKNLPHFESAHLSFVVVVGKDRILSYSASLDGKVHGRLWSQDRVGDPKPARPDGRIPEKLPPHHARRWCAHIDFTEKPEGSGMCTHARLHAHVSPDPDAPFQARVPLPWLAPADALDWLIAIACPALEPAK